MNAHSVIEDWESAPFDGGFDGLTGLGSRGFDGAVEAAGTWLFFRDGEPIAVVADLDFTPTPGDIDAFEGASGTQHEAPNAAVATLAAMLALDGDVRGEYFTDDTPLSAVDETLSNGGFTGYVELSENVLSGDYYYVYVDGEVEHLGFVGSGRRISGEEALSKAENEIGIYSVTAVSLPELELPEPEKEPEPEPTPEPTPTPTAETDSAPEADAASDEASTIETESDASETESDAERETPSDAASESDSDSTPEDTASASDPDETDTAPAATAEASNETTPDSSVDAEREDLEAADRPRNDRTDTLDRSAFEGESVSVSSTAPSPVADDLDDVADPFGTEPTADSDAAEPSREKTGIGSLTTRQVPSLDPEQSGHVSTSDSDTDRPGGARTVHRPPSKASQRRSTADSEAESSSTGTPGRSREAYEERLEAYETQIEELEAKREDDRARIEELETELETVRAERDELEAQLAAIDADDSSPSSHGSSMTVEDALAGTSLFVRERTRGEATLEDAHRGLEDRETVAENLRIEYHTTFDSADVTVGGEPFETWLRSSPSYEFAEWLVTDLLFEIRSTNAREGLAPLYDALPAIDRVGFDETIEIESADENDDTPETVHFDIVARDKKGNPLVVAHFDQRRDPTRADTIEPFLTGSSNVCEATGTLAAGVVVTSSYFEADAMSATEEATSTSLLSRSKHRSYVKLSRSSGYHLCLVEARDDTFNLTVPEL